MHLATISSTLMFTFISFASTFVLLCIPNVGFILELKCFIILKSNYGLLTPNVTDGDFHLRLRTLLRTDKTINISTNDYLHAVLGNKRFVKWLSG